MRNLKRALSLTLASVMLLGMMVVGAGAAGFPDVDEDNNVEAIEVLNAVDVIRGYDNGDFGPDDLVTRSQMAVIMANLLKLDYQYYEATCPFTDVPAWARGYVGACYANGITSGYSATIYGSDDGITPVQAASMMMRALGYFKYADDYKDGFEVVTVRQGSQIGIFDGVGSSATAQMTRDQVAKMALNALESEMVTFTGTPGMEVNGVTVGYRAEYTPRTSTESKYQAIENRTSDVSGGNNLNRGQYYVQLGEELYDGKLTKKYARDDFERPSINWQYDGKDIGTYVDYDLRKGEYTEEVKFSDLYDLLTYTTINENEPYRYVDGVNVTIAKSDFSRSNTAKVGGQGALTEVFVDPSRDEIIVTTINTYLAKANSNYNATSESLSLNVYTGSTGSSTAGTAIGGQVNGTTRVVDVKDVPEIETVEKDDYMLVYMSGKDNANSTTDYNRFDVVDIFATEIMSDAEISKFSIAGSAGNSRVVDKLTTGGTEYKTNCKAFYDYGGVLDEYDQQLLSETSYNIYMDRYDNVIGVDLYEGAKNYVFITGYDRGASHISVKTADAAAIFMDGTMDVITVNVTDTNNNIKNARPVADYAEYAQWGAVDASGDTNLNRWYTYTVNANGIYTLKPIKNFMYTSFTTADLAGLTDQTKTLNSANLFLDDSSTLTSKGRVYGEDNSVYITVEGDDVDYTPSDGKGITGVQGVYTGAQDVKIDMNAGTKANVNSDKVRDDITTDSHGDVLNRMAQETIEEKDAYVYTIFDSSNYIIASVVLGEAQGAAANYVYVLGGAKNERVERASDSRAANGDTYYWEFDAVLNGEKTTLTVKEKYSSTLKSSLNRYNVQEVRFDGDYVVGLKDVKLDDIFYFKANGDIATNEAGTTTKKIENMKIYDVGNRNIASWTLAGDTTGMGVGNVHNTYLETSAGVEVTDTARVNGTIYLQGRSLYVDNTAGWPDTGLALARDAKAVLVQPENGTVESHSCGSVSEAIGRLADRNANNPGTQFKGRIVAVLDSAGVAQWVVIISDTNLITGKDPNYTYNGKPYTLYLRDSLSNWWGNSGTDVAYVYTRATSRDTWTRVQPTDGIYNDAYEVTSGYEVQIRDRDIVENGQFTAFDDDLNVVAGVQTSVAAGTLTFIMPNSNVEIRENSAQTYTFSRFDIRLGQPIQLGDLDKDKVTVLGSGDRVASARAAFDKVAMNVTEAKGVIKNGKLVAEITWELPATVRDSYEVADSYTTQVEDVNGKKDTAKKVTYNEENGMSATADTTVLAGPLVVVKSTNEITVDTTKDNVQDYGFIVVATGSSEVLGTGKVVEGTGDNAGKPVIEIELTAAGEAAIVEGTTTINGESVTVTDGVASSVEQTYSVEILGTRATYSVDGAAAVANSVTVEGKLGEEKEVVITANDGYAITAITGKSDLSTNGLKSYTLTVTIARDMADIDVTVGAYESGVMAGSEITDEILGQVFSGKAENVKKFATRVDTTVTANDENDGTITVNAVTLTAVNTSAEDVTDVFTAFANSEVDSWDKMKEVYDLADDDKIGFIIIADEDVEIVSLIMIVEKADGTFGIVQGEKGNGLKIEPVLSWTWKNTSTNVTRTYTLDVSGITLS